MLDWIRQHWRTAVGVGSFITSPWWQDIWRGFKWVLDWISRTEAISGIWSMLGDLELPSAPWAWLAALVGLGFIGWDYQRSRGRTPKSVATGMSQQELAYRGDLRKFVLTKLSDMTNRFLAVVSSFREKFNATDNACLKVAYGFADDALGKGLCLKLTELQAMAQTTFTGKTTHDVNRAIAEFIQLYGNTKNYPALLEWASDLKAEFRDQWRDGEEKARDVLEELKATEFSLGLERSQIRAGDK